jgi:copper transport protein
MGQCGATARAGAILLVGLLLLPLASAHSQLLSSDPRAGSRLDAAPAQVTLTLTEPVDPAGTTASVTDSALTRVDQGDLAIQNGPHPVLLLHLKAGLPDGAYTITWEALSGTDGHHTTGTVGFAVGAFAPPGSTSQSVNKLDYGAALSRTALYAGFSLVFGAAAFLLWMRPVGGVSETLLRRAVLWGSALHLAGTLVLVENTLAETSLHWSQLGASSVGQVLLLRLILGAGAWVLALLTSARPTRTGPWAVTVLLLGAALGSARLGHGSSDGPATVALDLIHLLSTSTWVGSLALLLWTLGAAARRPEGLGPDAVRRMGIRYGTLALVCVILLWATGTIVGLSILGRDAVLDPGTTVQSAYGAFLAGKMALAALMVGLAAINRYVFLADATDKGFAGRLQALFATLSGGRIRPLETGGPSGLWRAVAVEAILGAVVLVLAGFLTSVSPPSAAAAGPTPLVLSQQGDTYLVHLVVDPPAQVGQSSFLHIAIEEAASGARLANNTCGRDSCVQVAIGYSGLNGTEPHVARPDGTGLWMVHDLVWTRSGNATVEVSISSADVFHDEVAFTVPVS